LQNVKSLVDIELRPSRDQWEKEKEKAKNEGKKMQYKVAEDLSKIDISKVPVAEGIDAVMKMHTVNVQLYRDSMAMLKKRKAEEVAEERKRKAEEVAEERKKRKTGPASGAGGGLGGFQHSAMRPAPHFMRSSRPGLGRCRNGAAFGA
jgi:parvulin-like peptidyl-prolyl isomerase